MVTKIQPPKTKDLNTLLKANPKYAELMAYVNSTPNFDYSNFGKVSGHNRKLLKELEAVKTPVGTDGTAPDVDPATLPDTDPRGFGYHFGSSGIRGRGEQAGIINRKTGKIQKGATWDKLSPEIQDLYLSVEGINNEIEGLGEKPDKDRPSVFNKVFDVLSRGNFASAEAFRRGSRSEHAGQGQFRQIAEMGHGFWAGLSGKKKTHFSEVIAEQPGHRNDKRSKLLGFVYDIALDPTTYIGVGAVSKAAKGAQLAENATRTRQAVEAISRINLPGSGAEKAREMLGGHLIGKKVGRDVAAKVQREADSFITTASRELSKAEKPRVYKEEYAKLVAAGDNHAVANAIAKRRANSYVRKMKDDTYKDLTDLVMKNVDPKIRKAIQLRVAGVPIAHTPAFVGTVASKALDNFGKVDLARKGMEKFSNIFNTSYRINNLVHESKLASNGLAHSIIQTHTKRIRDTYTGLDTATRDQITTKFINGINDPIANGKGVDVQEHFGKEMERIAGYMDPQVGELTVRDMNRFLPKEMQLLHDPKITNPVNLVRKSAATWTKKDAVNIQWTMNIALAQALNRRALFHSLRDTFGVNLTAAGNKVLAQKADFRSIAGKEDFRELSGYAFHPEIAESIERMAETLSTHDGIKQYVGWFDAIVRPWRAGVTTYNPGFQIRNAIGDAFLNFIDGAIDPRNYKSASRLLWRFRKDDPVMQNALTSSDPFMRVQQMPPSNNRIMRNKWSKGKQDKYITEEELWALYTKNGLRTGFQSTDFERQFPINRTAVGTALNRVNNEIGAKSTAREDFFRLAHFLHVVRTSKAPTLEKAAQEAAARVRKFHFDYSDLTATEKHLFRRIIPFYTWQRKSLPLMFELLFARPGVASSIPKGQRALSELLGYETDNTLLPSADLVLPDYMKRSGQVPIYTSAGGNTVYQYFANPMSDALRQMESPRNFLSLTSPFIRVPFEIAHKRQTFIDAPISDQTEFAERQLPLGNLLATIKKERGAIAEGEPKPGLLKNTALLQYLTAAGLTENTERKMRSELIRKRTEAGSRRKKIREKQGLPPLQ